LIVWKAATLAKLSSTLLSRLILTASKLKTVTDGIRQIANDAKKNDVLGRLLKRTELSSGLELQQVTVPIGR